MRASNLNHFQILDVSLPEFKLRQADQIWEIHCRVVSGAIVQVSIPFQWSVNIDSSIGGRATMTAFANDGADAFYRHDLTAFHRAFLSVAIDQPASKVDVSVFLIVKDNAENLARRITFNSLQLIMTPHSQAPYPFW